MDQSKPGVSDLAIPNVVVKPDMRFHVTRQPGDDYFNVKYVKDGRDVSEELEATETCAWFLGRFVKGTREQFLAREEAVQKVLDETWNFYEAWLTIPAESYQEPIKRWPQYQPQI